MTTVLMNPLLDALACPLDGRGLNRHGAALKCPLGHSFDISAYGYVNLLPVQKKRSKDPGDSKEMVTARRRFLDAGHYGAIARATSRMVLAGCNWEARLACLDAGCGEGYYLQRFAEDAKGHVSVDCIGLDISKWAVQAAARRDKQPVWLVGSNANLPIQSARLDRILCMFGFPAYAEFARVLRPGAELLQVDAGPNHLIELREIIYPQIKLERATGDAAPSGFERLASEALSYEVSLNSALEIGDLLTMTPHLYRASADGLAQARSLTSLQVTVDVRLTRFGRLREA
jgi:23S rRNA (guanine745-N1)-methyltransferase